MKAPFFFFLVFLSILLLQTLPSLNTAFADQACTDLVKKNCLSCHFETRICQKIKKQRGKRSWKRTVKSMVRHGANIEKSEQRQLITCLSKKGMPIQQLCAPQ
ncbi:MAG: hypothetical protein DSY50_08370 [Desulfobulbus sp.]|nr:MAG: hypothetical protein DSY50_08370 [Desulfobulbus sp.]RUM37803.1 MAG: hypothetical protein DSY58_03175 [Desulfobulbus sp.]RUM40176.1 MAG: hypothetical protein DSY70_04300 [Desulfobulbus sp.]